MSIKIFKTCLEYSTWRDDLDQTSGFVPTMGNLHLGHISLLEKALIENDVAIISIFVNPTQFSKSEDLGAYPKTLEDDIALIRTLQEKYNKEVIIFTPSENDIYPGSKETTYTDNDLRGVLEGEVRPEHFDGVTTVVRRLLEVIKPSHIYFGKKDYQQYIIIKKMIKDLNYAVRISGLPTVREDSGLAMSSRNNYLTDQQKEDALTLNSGLNKVKEHLNTSSTLADIDKVIESIKTDNKWNYLQVRHPITLQELENLNDGAVILGNYQIGSTRLLDNVEWGFQ